MYPYQHHPGSSSGQPNPSSSQQFLENVESTASRLKRVFGKKRPSRAGEDGTQSDAPTVKRMTAPRISALLPRKDPKPVLQFASSTLQGLGQRLNKPLPPRVPSQIGPPPGYDPPQASHAPDPSRISSNSTSTASRAPSEPVSVPQPKGRTIYRTSQLEPGPEISAALEYMLDPPGSLSPRTSTNSPPPRPRPSQEQRLSPPSPRAMRSGSFGNEAAANVNTNAIKRRSMSLSMIPTIQVPSASPPSSRAPDMAPPSSFNPPPTHLTPASSTPHQRSRSALPTYPIMTSSTSLSESPATHTDAYASGIISHTNPDKSASNFKGKLSAWSVSPSSSPSKTSRGSSPSHSKAASMVASIGPAATAATGMAMNFSKRAYEKVNSIWGGPAAPLSAGSGSGNHSPSSSEFPNVSRTRSRQNGHGQNGWGGSVTDVETSRRRLGPSHGGAAEEPIGPYLGTMLRPPFRRSLQAGGLVFGRPLAECVRDTKPLVVLGSADDAGIEARFIPALVLRCVQHIERWGLAEEGLFRIGGRASHINKLRAEFGNGADYDLQMCGPGDLDPHAVSSVLKAFLRELPEPILTHAKTPLYDAAFQKAKDEDFMNTSVSAPATLKHNAGHTRLGSTGRVGLPSNPRDVSTLPSRASNAHYFAQAEFEPQSEVSLPLVTPQEAFQELLSRFRDLTTELPRENRDLLVTIAELLSKAAGQAKITKMPISNLLLVLCPSMNMNPGILKVLVENHQFIFTPALLLPAAAENTERSNHLQPPLSDALAAVESSASSDSHTDITSWSRDPSVERPILVEDDRSREDIIPTNALPIRKQSLRRHASGQQMLRTTPTSSPSAYRETFVTEGIPKALSRPASDDSLRPSGRDSPPPNQRRASSRATSPLQQGFSSSDLARPTLPMGPRGPRALPAPLILQRERSNTLERQSSISQIQQQSIVQPDHLRSASASTFQDSASMTTAVPGDKYDLEIDDVSKVDSDKALTVEEPSPTLVSLPEDSTHTPNLPEIQAHSAMTSGFATRQSALAMAVSRIEAAHPSPSLDVPSPSSAPSSSNSNTLMVPSLPDFQPLEPMTSSFANRTSSLSNAKIDTSQLEGQPSPRSAQSAGQSLTPLLAEMEKEHAGFESSQPVTPDLHQMEYHPLISPLNVTKKPMYQPQPPRLSVDQPPSAYPEDMPSTATSMTTDTSDGTNIFTREFSWPAVPQTLPTASQIEMHQRSKSLASDNTLSQDYPDEVTEQHSSGQVATVARVDDSQQVATARQIEFPRDSLEPPSPVSPDVANGEYPPNPYPLVPPNQAASEDVRDEETILTKAGAPLGGLEPSHPPTKRYSTDLYHQTPSISTVRAARPNAPRLTVNSKELLSSNDFWATELQRVLRNGSPTEARRSTELSGMLEAAGL